MDVPKLYIMDTEGDVLIILDKRDDVNFCPWVPPEHNTAAITYDTEPVRRSRARRHSPVSQAETHFLVSAKMLAKASSFFSTMFHGPWREATQLQPDGRRHVHLQDLDMSALHVVLNVLHLNQHEAPRATPPETLAKIAIVVDYFQCHNGVSLAGEFWFRGMTANYISPKTYSRDLLIWTFGGSVMAKTSPKYKKYLRVAVMTSPEPFQTGELPMAQSIVDKIDELRCSTIGKLLDVFLDTMTKLANGTGHCTFHCGSMLLGSMMRMLGNGGQPSARPQEPYLGLTIEGMISNVKAAVEPWINAVPVENQAARRRRCPLSMEVLWRDMESYTCSVQFLAREVDMLREDVEGRIDDWEL